jgi:hypothetical protein
LKQFMNMGNIKMSNKQIAASVGNTQENLLRLYIMALLIFISSAVAASADSNCPAGATKAIIQKNKDLGLEKFPIGFWNYANLKDHGQYFTAEEVRSWADAGFTLVQSPHFDSADRAQVALVHKILKWSHAEGLKVIISDPRTLIQHSASIDADSVKSQIEGAVSEFAKSPAVFGFYVGDEPNTGEFPKCVTAYNLLKQSASQLHPFINLLPYYSQACDRVGVPDWPTYLDNVVKQMRVDFLCYDCYSQMGGDLDIYYKNLRLYREASIRNLVPFWTTVLSVGHYSYKCPNYDELRWQFNTAICSGAQGIMWFFYYMREPHYNYRFSPVDEFWEKTQTYYDLRRIHRSFNRRYKDLFLNIAVRHVYFYPMAYGGGETFEPNSPNFLVSCIKTDTPNPSLLIGEFSDANDRPYVMVVNNSMKDNAAVTIRFPGKRTRLFTMDWNGNERETVAWRDGFERWRILENSIEVDHPLAPGQEVVYRVDRAQQ